MRNSKHVQLEPGSPMQSQLDFEGVFFLSFFFIMKEVVGVRVRVLRALH